VVKLFDLLVDFGRPSEHSPQRLAPLIDRVLTLENVKSILDAQTLAADGLSNFATSVQKTRHVVLDFRRVVGGGCAILQRGREWDVDRNTEIE
jgi:hypothetical protein